LRIILDAADPVSDAAFGVEFLAVGAGKCSERLPEAYRGCAYYIGPGSRKRHSHELGYLLLRSHAHAASGIMRAHLEVEELRRIVKASLLFMPQQGSEGTLTIPVSIPSTVR